MEKRLIFQRRVPTGQLQRAAEARKAAASPQPEPNVQVRRDAQEAARQQRIAQDAAIRPGVGPVDTSQLRINQRRANEQVQQQSATRAQGLLERGVGIPIRGLTDEARLPQFLGGPGETPLQEAQRARRAEFTRTGTVSPELEAAIFRLENPGFVPQQREARTGADVRRDFEQVAGSPSADPFVRQKAGLSDAGIDTQRQQSFIETLRTQTPEQRAASQGVSPTALKIAGLSFDFRGKGFSNDGSANIISNLSEEEANELREAGILGEFSQQPDGSFRGVVSQAAIDAIPEINNATDILEGRDITQEEASLSRLQEEERFQQEQERQSQFFGQQETQLTAQGIARNNDIGATNAGLQQFLGLINDGTPEGQAIASLYQNAFASVQGNEQLLRDSAQLQVGQAQDSFNQVQNILQQGVRRSEGFFSSSLGLLEDTRDRNVSLAAQQAELADTQLLYQKEKLTRQARQTLSDDIDRRYATLALSGGFGSSNGLDEVSQARARGEQAILDLQQEFAFKRTDIMLDYTSVVNQAEELYSTNVLTAANQLKTELGNIDIQGIANQRTKEQAIRLAIQNMGNQITVERREKAKTYSNAAKAIQSAIDTESKAKQDNLIQTKDTVSFVGTISERVNKNQTIKDSREIKTRFSLMETALNDFKTGEQETAVAVDQALITVYNKMLDPSSVVRESEYARTPQDLSLISRIEGQTAKQFITGGAGLTPEVREDLVKMARRFKEQYDKRLDQEIQPYISQVNMFNSQEGLVTPVNLTDVISPELIPSLPKATLDTWKLQMGKEASLGSQESLPGFLSPESAPPQGFRTDRHNNPTAFTTGIARQAGLVEGVDYEEGDPFKAGRSTLKTARLIGDPLEITRRVIDSIGFKTRGNQNRWAHTTMTKNDWNSLTVAQKNKVILEMYQREGGTGVLAAEQLPTTTLANAN